MTNSKNITIDKEVVENILIDLNNILLTCDNLGNREKIENIIKTLEKTIDVDKVSIDDLVVNKMRETKGKNDDLHLKLYMLHRNFQEGKITEKEVEEAYKNYYTLI